MSETSRPSSVPGEPESSRATPAAVLRPVGPRKLLEIVLVPAADGIPVRVEAYPGERYVLKDPLTGKAPRQLRVWRVARDLWIALDTQAVTDASLARPDLVIGQYFDPAFVANPADSLVGLDENGLLRSYMVSVEGAQPGALHRELSTLVSVTTQIIEFPRLEVQAIGGVPMLIPGLLGGVALAAAAGGGGGGGGGNTPPPPGGNTPGTPTLSAPETASGLNQQEAADGTSLVIGLPANAAVGDVVTTVLTRPNGSTLTLSATLSATDIASGTLAQSIAPTALTGADGNWSASTTIARGANASAAAVLSFAVDTAAPLAPGPISIPEAVGGITATEAADGTVITVRLPGSGLQAGDRLDLLFTRPAGGALTRTVTLAATDISAGQVSVTLEPAELKNAGTFLDGAWQVRATITDGAGNVSSPTTSTFDLDTRLVLQGSVAAGLVTSGVTVQAFGSGGQLLGTTTVRGDGTWQIDLSGAGGYRGPVLVKASDANGTTSNYLDEVSASPRSLDTSLRALTWVGDGQASTSTSSTGATVLQVSVTPLTELATRLAGVTDDRPPADTSAIDQVNRSLAQALSLSGVDLTATPVPTNTAAFNAADGLSAGEKIGLVLAKLSGLDQLNGGRVADTLAQLQRNVQATSGTVTLTDAGAALLDQGRQQALRALKLAPASAEQTFLADSVLNRQILGDVVVTRQDITADRRLIVFGTALPGTTVTVTMPDASVEAALTGPDGTFVTTSRMPQPTLIGQLVVTGRDALEQPATHLIPSAPTIQPGNGKLISGTGTPGSMVEVFDGSGASLGKTTVDPLGNWSLTPTRPVDASGSLRAIATDTFGNVSSASQATVAVEQASLSIPEAVDGYVNAAERDDNGVALVIGLPGNAPAGSRVDTVLTRPDGSTLTLRSTLTAADIAAGSINQVLSASSLADNGRYQASVSVVTPAGSSSVPVGRSFVVDTVAPAAPGVGASNDQIINGSSEAGTVVTVTLAGGQPVGSTGVVGPDGNWTLLSGGRLSDGAELIAVATDAAGNLSPTGRGTVRAGAVLITAALDNAGPGLGLLSDGGATNDTSPLITGAIGRALLGGQVLAVYRKSAGGTYVKLGTATVDGQTWSFQDGTGATGSTTTPLAAGSHTWQARVETASGPVADIAPTGEFDLVVITDAPGAPRTALSEATGSDTFISAAERASEGGVPAVSTLPAEARVGDTLVSVLKQPDGSTRTLQTQLSQATVAFGSVTQLLPADVLDADGAYELRTTLVSAVTGLSSASATNRFNVDAVAPGAPSAALAPASDSGVLGDQRTRVTLPTLTGVAEPGSIVRLALTLEEGRVAYYNVGAHPSTGAWSVDTRLLAPDGAVASIASLSEGSHPFSVVAIDPAGNASAATSGALQIDTQVLAPGIAPSNGTVAVAGTGEPGATVTLLSGSNLLGNARVGNDGSWRVVLAARLADGVQVAATQVDLAGNVSAQATATINGSVPSIDPTNGRVVTGGAKPGETIVLTATGGLVIGTAVADAQGRWSITPDPTLAHGTALTATVQASGLSDSATVDAQPPVPPAATLEAASDSGIPGDGRTQVVLPAIVGGSSTPGDLITVRMPVTGEVLTTRVASDGAWRVKAANPLPHGTSGDVEVRATDAAGNTSESTRVALVIDTVGNPPTIALEAGSDSGQVGDLLTNATRPVLRGTAEAGSTVRIVIALDASNSATFTVKANDTTGEWRLDTATTRPDGRTLLMPALVDGSRAVVASATDAAGNASGAVVMPLVIDTQVQAPTIAPANGFGSASGTGEPGARVVLSAGSTALGSASVDSDGSWRIALATPLANGTVLQAVQTDAAGNVSAPGTVTVNALRPWVAPSNGRTVSGTGQPGDTIVVSTGADARIGAAVVAADGSWSVTVSTPLADGTVVTATDQQNGLSGQQTVDAVAPVAPTARLDSASDSGAPGDGLTNVARPTLGGTGAAPGDTITVKMPGTGEVLRTRVSAAGTWSVTATTALPDATVGDATVTATDPSGNESAATRVPLVIDRSPPPAAIGSLDPASDTGRLGDGKTRIAHPVLVGSAEPGTQVELTILGRTYVTTATGGSWRVALPAGDALADGVYRPVVKVTDGAGNSSTSTLTELEIDATPPATPVTALDPASDTGRQGDNRTRDTQPTIRGLTEPGASVVVFLNGKTYAPTPDNTGTWSLKVPEADALVDATYTPQVLVTDGAGNSVLADGGRFTIDTTPPAAPRGSLDTRSDTGVVGDNRTAERSPALSGTAEAGSTVEATLIGAGRTVVVTTTANGSGVWTATVPAADALTNGTYTLALKSTDGAGNSSTGVGTPFEVYAVTLATPQITQVEDDVGITGRIEDGSATDDATPTVRISGPTGSTMEVWDGTTSLGTATETATGIYTFTPGTALTEGVHTLTVRASDSVGNTSSVSAAFRFTVDVTPPALPTVTQNAGTEIAGTASLQAGETLTLRVGAATYSVVPTQGAWLLNVASATPVSGALNPADAPYVVRAETRDAAGNLAVVVRGSPRDDVITLLGDDIARLAAGTQQVHGGEGADTLVFGGTSAPVDLTVVPDTAITGIERISLGRNTLRLAASDVLALGVGELVIDGVAGGAVRLQGTGWSATGEVTEGGSTYAVYESAGARVKIQASLSVTPNATPQGAAADPSGARSLGWPAPDPAWLGDGAIRSADSVDRYGEADRAAGTSSVPENGTTLLRLDDVLAPMGLGLPAPGALRPWQPGAPPTIELAHLLDGSGPLPGPAATPASHAHTTDPIHFAITLTQPLAPHHDLL